MALLDLKNWVPSWFNIGGSVAGRQVPGVQLDGNGSSKKPITQDTALALSAVWACTKLISESVAGMPINFYQLNSDGTRTLDKKFHLSKLMNDMPNRYQTGVDYRNTISYSQAMLGNDYSLKQFGTGGKLIGLLPLMAAQMQVKLLDDGSKVFMYTNGKTTIAYSEQSIWHNMLMPTNAIIGLSPLEYGARAMGIADAAEDKVSLLANNGFKPSGVLMYDKVLSEDQRKQIKKSFENLASGQGDSLQVLEANMKYEQVSLSPKDSQLLETRVFQTRDIARFYSVPPIMIGDTDAGTVWGSGIEQIIEGFFKFGVKPYLVRYEAGIKKNLLTREERANMEVEFDFSALLRGDLSTRIENAAASVKGGLKTIDEARMELDGSAKVPGGSKIFMQQQMTPIEELKNDTQNLTINSGT